METLQELTHAKNPTRKKVWGTTYTMVTEDRGPTFNFVHSTNTCQGIFYRSLLKTRLVGLPWFAGKLCEVCYTKAERDLLDWLRTTMVEQTTVVTRGRQPDDGSSIRARLHALQNCVGVEGDWQDWHKAARGDVSQELLRRRQQMDWDKGARMVVAIGASAWFAESAYITLLGLGEQLRASENGWIYGIYPENCKTRLEGRAVCAALPDSRIVQETGTLQLIQQLYETRIGCHDGTEPESYSESLKWGVETAVNCVK